MRLASLRLKLSIRDPRGNEARNGFESAQYDMSLDSSSGEITIRAAGVQGGLEVCTHVSNVQDYVFWREKAPEKGKGK